MKVEEGVTTTRKRNISIQYDIRNPLLEAEALLAFTVSNANANANANANKKLRRLPHVFSRVLELPFRSDADVSVEELPHSFRFVVDTPGIEHVEAQTVEIHPGLSITKVVVNQTSLHDLDLDLDIWRFRLPESTRPELANASLVGGDLIVTVPKAHDDAWRSENRGMDGGGTLVLVQ